MSIKSSYPIPLNCLVLVTLCALVSTNDGPGFVHAQTLVQQYRPPIWNQDASLNDAAFVDKETGCCVGDHGLILVTNDGGKSWRQVYSGVSSDLESVCFTDSKHGWAVGGITTASLDRSMTGGGFEVSRTGMGVVLRTLDGGRTWKVINGIELPPLTWVQFSDHKNGFAVGAGTHFYPSGIFTTGDGGKTWTSGPAEQLNYWKTAILSAGQIVPLGMQNDLAEYNNGQIRPANLLVPGRVSINDIAVNQRGHGIAIGNQATIITAKDATGKWQFSNQHPIPKHTDLNAVAMFEDMVWFAGNPGTEVYRWNRQTDQWSRFSTGQPLPVKSIRFIDSQHGWALCSLGTILATQDGGQSWQVQRGQRNAIQSGTKTAQMTTVASVCIVNDVRQIPLEMIGKFSAEEGYLTVVVVVAEKNRRDFMAARHASSRLGNSEFIWLDPSNLRNPQIENGRPSSNEKQMWIEKSLADLIRAFRPNSVVLGERKSVFGEAQFNLGQAVANAVKYAGDASVAVRENLPAWKVPRTYKRISRPDLASVFVAETQFLPRLGHLLSDYLGPSRSMLGIPVTERNDTALLVIQASANSNSSSRRLFDPKDPNIARRPNRRTSAGRADSMRTASRKQRLIRELLEWPADSERNSVQHRRVWISRVEDLTRTLDSEDAGLWLFQLANEYWQSGDGNSAILTLEALVNRYPKHYMVDPSLLWLVKHLSSAETLAASPPPQVASGIRQVGFLQTSETVNGAQAIGIQAGTQTRKHGDHSQLVFQKPDLNNKDDQKPAGEKFVNYEVERLKTVRQIADFAIRQRSALTSHPEFELAIATVNRKTQGNNKSATPFSQIAQSPTASPLLKYVSGRERQLADSRLPIGDGSLREVSMTNDKPHLDGILDEQFWQRKENKTIHLSSKANRPATTVQIGYDNQYFYLAISCEKGKGHRYTKTADLRRRDSDLDSRDRVTICLDTDRDYQSYFEMTVDYRGWAGEKVDGNPNWDPDWFIAQADDEKSWTIEAAIPMEEILPAALKLTNQSPKGQVWAFSIRRQIPDFQTMRWPNVNQIVDSIPLGLLKLK